MNSLHFYELQPYIENDAVTDINFNGRTLWIDDLKKGRYEVIIEDVSKINQLCYQLANYVNQSFNPVHPIIEAELDELRISLIHESIAKTGHSLSIRKTPKKQRLHLSSMLLEKYTEKQIAEFLIRCVEAHCHVVVCGLPGAGKTELLKFLMQYIPPKERVITIEDTLELRYHDIHPHKDCVALRVNGNFDYVCAIKASLRQRPDWMMISEIRSVEVSHFLECASTGTHILTTIHAMDALNIPKRMMHMFKNESIANEVILKNIHELIDLGIRVEAKHTKQGIQRYIAEIAIFDVVDDEIYTELLYQKGKKKFLLPKMGKVKSKLDLRGRG